MSNENKFFPHDFAKRFAREMRAAKVTVREFAQFAGVSQARVRELRTTGRAQWQWEWLQTLAECVRSKGATV